MTSFRVRPKFKIVSEKKINEIVELLTQKLEVTAQPVEGKVFNTHGLLRIKPTEQHYWSPQLSISFEETEAHKTIIRGMYGPHPSVWAVFLMGYVLLGLGMFFITMVGLVRLSLKIRFLYFMDCSFFIWWNDNFVVVCSGWTKSGSRTNIYHSSFF